MKNIFKLNRKQLKGIALDLKCKIDEGLQKDGSEIKGIPTYIHPLTGGVEGTATVLDLGGTNYRAAVVKFADGKSEISPENPDSKDLSVMKTKGFTETDLLTKQAEFVNEIDLPEKSPIGYCFSYPGRCLPDGDAELITWTKSVDITEMVGKPVGKPLLEYLNKTGKATFTGIKVINDTVASLTDAGFDAYIGLIVGTGTNMAAFVNASRIPKLNPGLNWHGLTPVNFESGNYNPPHLTEIDEVVDKNSDIPGAQRFEKAVSGMYLGQIFREMFPDDGFDENFDAKRLTGIINHPNKYRKRHVKAAIMIYKRSAKLVAASLAGLIDLLISHDNSINSVKITAEGSLFWSKVKNCRNYNKSVNRILVRLLDDMGHKGMKIDIAEIENANLIGSGIAALS